MQLLWGNLFTWAANAAGVRTRAEKLFNKGGQCYAERRTFTVEGYLYGSTQSEITLAISQLQTALAVQNQVLKVVQDDGANSAIILSPIGAISGVRSEILAFPRYENSDYATQRYFTAQFSAEYPYAGTGALLLDWTESLTFSGGYPLVRFRNAINGPPVKQIVYPSTPYELLQTGRAVGYRDYPSPAPPKFPAALVEAPRIVQTSPERKGQGYQGFTVEWSYRHIDIAPAVALPALWV